MTLKDRAKAVSYSLFALGDRAGVHLLPSHYYSSLPSWKWLRQNEGSWRKPIRMAGIEWDLDAQVDWMAEQAAAHAHELPRAQLLVDAEREVGGFRYGGIEAQMLYGVLRTRQPKRIVEIGSGSSTLVMSQAVQRNVAEGAAATEIIAIDPYTGGKVAHLPHVTGRRDHGILLEADALGLESGDVLFIDSTHAVRTGSEVPHLYLELLPALPPGVLIHIHDIYLPYLYTPHLYTTYFDWQETALVAALLVGNPRLVVRAGMAGVHHERPEGMRKVFPEYRPASTPDGIFPKGKELEGDFPSSLWLETV